MENSAISHDEMILKDARSIVEDAEKRGVILRVVGALAIRLHSEKHAYLFQALERLGNEKPLFSDIDFVAYSKQYKNVKKALEALGFVQDSYIGALLGGNRLFYNHPKGYYHIDVFFDKLEFSHDVYFGSKPGEGRLELDKPTISLADLTLSKIQIHEINEKDIKDLIVLFAAHGIGDIDGKDVVNAKYVAEILANDWGFWYDAARNLEQTRTSAEKYYQEKRIDEEFKHAAAKIDELLSYINNEPKTKNWQKRAKKGTGKIWYRDVEDIER